ncbi:restriction endonuclease subunit S [Pseudomonas sp. DTU_2021_1001937_2_SI_NGA_ILE_001]|uniref:restriction endonuclease subunit S n=1 Tax=Pseudomonas sp. DTU_2021_1001937_2_SI_NGA_ILE_001 TaxID=3077589 RepID=UPI0028FC23DD|nr:restriction endonuclease subunit S [Pseudomonas sp. DTU_2021_1001937_2_SI_NGA_ILE_001]WNW11829.1 restriction endonuclease subunit S [Pseudomonas sp. DTU_2021_1001937_2_SI_NGA_ILE_001]
MRLPGTWVEVRLGDVLSRVDTKIDPQASQASSHFYVGLEHIESHTGRLLREAEDLTESSDILSIKTAFNTGDILYGKLRPNLNKVHLALQDGICSTDIWALRASEAVLPDFALRYLRSPAIYVRAAQVAVGANLPRLSADAFDRLPMPLPTLPEQQRIVDVLRQVEEVANAKRSISEQIDQLVRTAYWEHFGAWYAADGLIDPVRISDYIADSQYGVSEAMEGHGTHAVLRMNSITTSGWLDLSDLKYASLSQKDIDSTELHDGDLLFNRTNSKELVGKCAIWRPVTGSFSFASYLVRLRLKQEMLPEYLWATLNSAYGKYRLLNSAKQAVSMANVSPTDLGRLTVPLPPRPLQEKFATFVRALEELRTRMISKLPVFAELQEVANQQALIGDLTAQWRKHHASEITEAVRVRDALLRKRGTKIINASAKRAIGVTAQADATLPIARHWLLNELSEFQRQVLAAFIEYCQQSGQPLLVEDPEEFSRFCDDDVVMGYLNNFGETLGNRVRRSLSQLAAQGLIAKVTLPKQDPESGERDYLKAFRPLRAEEYTRMGDVRALRKVLSAGTDQQYYFFEVQLDYETSEKSSAGGMFQVVSLEDDQGKDFAHLIDQGQHYASLDELRADLARSLEVDVEQIELEAV